MMRSRVEKAKPSYLERMHEDDHPEEETKEEEKKEERAPISGIPDTLMIRKTKRKFIVVSLHTIHRDEKGNILSVGGSTDFDSDALASKPDTVNVEIQQNKEGAMVSTRK